MANKIGRQSEENRLLEAKWGKLQVSRGKRKSDQCSLQVK